MKFVLLLIACALVSVTAAAEVATGELFEQKSNFAKKLFDLEMLVDFKEGLTHTSAIYKDLQGQSMVVEKGLLKGDELVWFDIDQSQTKEKGRVEVRGDKVLFTYEKDGKKKSAEEKLKKPLLTTANFNFFVANHWDDFVSGKEVEVRFGVWYRLESVGFKIFKVGEKQNGTQKLIQLRMKPTSFVIAAIVDPLNLWYSEDGKKLVELSGRVSPKILKGSEFKDLDADVRYKYPF